MNFLHFKKAQLKYICSKLNTNPIELEFIVNNIDQFYHEWSEKKIDRETGTLKTFKDGTPKERLIRPSIKRLKEIQKKIKINILDPIPLPDNVHGNIKGRNNVTNAKKHQGNKFQFKTDLHNFYPSITNKQILNSFLLLGFTNHFAHWLTKLVTWKKQLPQGTTTSPSVANLVFFEVDKKLISFCAENNIIYTRYVDDLTFSCPRDFKLLIPKLLKIIQGNGFKINYRKTKYKTYQEITGIVTFNNFIDVTKEMKEKARSAKINSNMATPYDNYINYVRSTNKNLK